MPCVVIMVLEKSSVLHLVAGLYNNLYGGNIYFDDFDIKKLNMNFFEKISYWLC